jgi:hypothetical protein
MPLRDGPTAGARKTADIARDDVDRPDLGIFAAIDAADAQLPPHRARTAGAVRRRDARLRRHPGQAARRIPQGRNQSKSRRRSRTVLFCGAGAGARRQRARARKLRPNPARLIVSDLGMDQPRSAADDGPRLCRGNQQADQCRQAKRPSQGSRHVPDQGRKISRKCAQLARKRRADPRQARNPHGLAFDLSQPHQDDVHAARA